MTKILTSITECNILVVLKIIIDNKISIFEGLSQTFVFNWVVLKFIKILIHSRNSLILQIKSSI
jgi:hypothetical protein